MANKTAAEYMQQFERLLKVKVSGENEQIRFKKQLRVFQELEEQLKADIAEAEVAIDTAAEDIQIRNGWLEFIHKAPSEINKADQNSVVAYIASTHPNLTLEVINRLVTAIFENLPQQEKINSEKRYDELNTVLNQIQNQKAQVIDTQIVKPILLDEDGIKEEARQRKISSAFGAIKKVEDEKKAAIDTILSTKRVNEMSVISKLKDQLKLKEVDNQDKYSSEEKAQILYAGLQILLEQDKKNKAENLGYTIDRFSPKEVSAISDEIRELKAAFPNLLSKDQIDINRLLKIVPPEIASRLYIPPMLYTPMQPKGFLDVDTKNVYSAMALSKNPMGYLAQRFFTDPHRNEQLKKIADVKKYLKSQKMPPKEKAQLLFIALKAIDNELVREHGKRKTNTPSRLEKALEQEMYQLNKTFNIHFTREIDENLKIHPAAKEVERILGIELKPEIKTRNRP